MTIFRRVWLLIQHVYGKEAVKRGPDEWDARACVEGDYSWAEQQPDADLGKVMPRTTVVFACCTVGQT